MILFVIPLIHPKAAKNWNIVTNQLYSTINSIQFQKSKEWNAILVVNKGTKIPYKINENIKIFELDMPPPHINIKNKHLYSKEELWSAIRYDKGMKVYHGIKNSNKNSSKYIMVVDADDLIHKNIAKTVENNNIPGFCVKKGYIWNGKSFFCLKDKNFDEKCGTSLIIRKDLLDIDFTSNKIDKVKVMQNLGSHRFIKEKLQKNGHSLKEIEYYCSVYMVDHGENHSSSNYSKYINKKINFRNYISLIKKLKFFFSYTAKNDFGYSTLK